MTVRRLDANGDIVTSGQQFITERLEAGQTVVTRLKLFLNEYFRDLTEGTPWFQDILGKATNLGVKEAAIKRRILQTEGVNSIITFDTNFDINSHEYEVATTILTDFGEISLAQQGLING